MNEVTQLLSALCQGDPHPASRLPPLVYDASGKGGWHIRTAQEDGT
jgi:hypothetical protein